MKKFVDDCEEDREKRVLMELPKFSKSENKTKSKSQYLTNLKVVNAAIEAVLWFRRSRSSPVAQEGEINGCAGE
ncbi:hypothetical protein DY000_02042789 [Brassica cretica]|uniref:Uncharacterized protein n=1 Tax=Brassica cretica TaxID=69181 RepID=A0ABQ7BRG9_BRACR|nr:hypothetical protein DY000_02042789 [Brassica cretica]